MPEGDTVLRAARTLDSALGGRVLTRTRFNVPALATSDLSGQTLTEVTAAGKHLLMRTDAGLTLRSHLRMEGSWHLYPHGARWRGPAHQVRAVLETADHVAVGFRLGMLDLVRSQEEDGIIGHLGPDVLGPGWDAAEAARRLSANPARPIAEALLDQRNLAGVGNLYKSEVLFCSGIDPHTPAGAVPDLEALCERIRRLMQTGAADPAQATAGAAGGRARRWVFERAGRGCMRCGTTVRAARQGGRVTYWCPSCQGRP